MTGVCAAGELTHTINCPEVKIVKKNYRTKNLSENY